MYLRVAAAPPPTLAGGHGRQPLAVRSAQPIQCWHAFSPTHTAPHPTPHPTHPHLSFPWQVGVGVNYSPRQTSLSVQRATDRRDSVEERFFRRLEAEVCTKLQFYLKVMN